MNSRLLRTLVAKDLRVFLTDRRALVTSVVAPLVLASFFAVVLGGGGSGSGGSEATSTLAVSVADLDRSPVSRAIVRAIEGDRSLSVLTGSAESTREDVLKGRAVVGVLIPTGFGEAASRALFGGRPRPILTLLRDPTRAAEAAMVRGMLAGHVMESVAGRSFGPDGLVTARARLAEAGPDDLSLADRLTLTALIELGSRFLKDQTRSITRAEPGANSVGFGMPFETDDQAVTAGTGKDADRIAANAHAFGGMAVQFLLFGAIEAGVGLLNDRQKGLWRRVRSAPVHRLTILLGRIISGTIIALATFGVIFSFGALVFGIRVHGSAIAFSLVCVAYALMAACFGLLIAAVGKTPQSTRSLSVLAVLILVMLGGAWVPTFVFPQWLQRLTPLIPTRWAVDGLDATLTRGYNLADSMPAVAMISLFATLFGLLAAVRFRWDVD